MASHTDLANLIWEIANLLRGPYRPPQYERVMLPLVVLRRFDCVLADTKQAVVAEAKRRENGKIQGDALDSALNRISGHRFHNRAPYDFRKLLGDPDNINQHLMTYINGFSANVRRIFEYFEFTAEIERMTTHRAQPHSDYDNYQQMDDLRRSLTDEQHGLCCYCTSRVKADRSALKVEHWQCQTGFPHRRLAYANLLAACNGGEGKPLRQQHCDSLKGNNSLMWNPADAAHVIESRVEYLADGTIRSPDPAFDAELNAVIGLNQPHLRNNRKSVLDSIKIWWQAGARTDNQIRSQIAKFSPAAGVHDPFSPVIVWFLKRKLGI